MNRDSFSCKVLDPKYEKILTETFGKNHIKREGFLFPESFKNFADRIRQMEIRDDDIWVCTFPKSGTTWVQEMVWCIKKGMNHKDVQNQIYDRFPFLEISASLNFCGEDSIDRLKTLPSPRFIKTHVPFNLLPEKLQNFSTNAKIIHVTRNPRDTMVSYYHHCTLLRNFKGTFLQFVELFFEGAVPYGPFPAHLKGYLAHSKNPKILFLKYEEMKKDLRMVIEKTSTFLDESISENEIDNLLDHLSFSSMKQNPAVNHQLIVEMKKKMNATGDDGGQFMRRGIVGDWKDKLDAELCQRFEQWENSHLNEIDFTSSV